jgi:hypothetical protein
MRSLLYFAAVLTLCPSVRADVRRCARRFVRGRRRPLPGMQSRSSGRHVAVTPTHYERVQCWTVVNGRRCSCAGPCLVVYGCGRWLWKVRGTSGPRDHQLGKTSERVRSSWSASEPIVTPHDPCRLCRGARVGPGLSSACCEGCARCRTRRSSASSRVRAMHRACRSQVGGRTWSERLMILTRSSGAGSALGRRHHWACGVSAYGE